MLGAVLELAGSASRQPAPAQPARPQPARQQLAGARGGGGAPAPQLAHLGLEGVLLSERSAATSSATLSFSTSLSLLLSCACSSTFSPSRIWLRLCSACGRRRCGGRGGEGGGVGGA